MGQCELTYQERVAIDPERARAQHHTYEKTLQAMGCTIVALAEEPELPDSIFVEDVAVVLDELAMITRPGAASRRPETKSVAALLQSYRELFYMQFPGTLDGGDVLRVDQTIYVGVSRRSNRSGIEQLASATAPWGYRVVPVAVGECLHLKSAVTQVGRSLILINRRLVEVNYFSGMDFIDVAEEEPLGANALLIGDQVIYSAAYPRTRDRLEEKGIMVKSVDVPEVEKAEGAVTCCSLIFRSCHI
jgi:dimethylargininase